MGFALSHAAGASSDALQELLKRKFLEQIQTQRLNEDARQADLVNAQATTRNQIEREQLAAMEKFRQDQMTAAKEQRDFQNARATREDWRDQLEDLPTGARITGEQAVPFAKYGRNTLLRPTTNAAGEPEFEFTGTRGQQEATRKEGEADTRFYQHAGFTEGLAQRRDAVNFEQQKELARIRAADGQGGRSPYFTYQTTFDPSGRPIGAIRFDARGGPPQAIDIAGMTAGGQLRPPPGQTGQMSILNETSEDQLTRLETMFEDGAKNLVGPVEGRARSIGQQVPGVPVNKDFADFEAATSAFKNAVIKAITGAQMSEPEAKRIMTQIPSINDKPEVWRSKAAQSKKNLGDLARRLKTPSAGPGVGGGRGGGGAGAGAAPAAVVQALQGVGDGRHTLSDGSVWIKQGNTIQKGQ